MTKNQIVLLTLMLISNFAKAETKVTLNVVTDESMPFISGELNVSEPNSSSATYHSIFDATPHEFSLERNGTYNFTFFSLGHEPWSQQYNINGDTTIVVSLVSRGINLSEITVQGNNLPKTTATGKIYHLSKEAKESGDPFRALSEIPLLNVDIVNQSVKLTDGASPLVLIDGKYLNSGIKPIDPKFIESVEITEVVNAKYLQMGVSKIINIKLRRNVPFYTYVEARTRNDVPTREGFGGANFEFGTKKFAVSGNLFGNYLRNDKSNFTSSEISGENQKYRSGQNTDKSNGWEGELLFKWVPNQANYISGVIKGKDTHSWAKGTSQGFYNLQQALSTNQAGKVKNGGWLTALFHEYTFANNSTITTFAKYNRGFYDSNDRYSEQYNNAQQNLQDLQNNEYWEASESVRDQYTVSIDYDSNSQSYGNFAIGNNFEHTTDHNTNIVTDPYEKANVRTISNYTYATYTNQWKRMFYMASVGLQYMNAKTNNGNNSWWRPRVSGTLGFSLPHSQSIRGVYYLDNSLPRSIELHTFNTSTNPWLRIEGNPYLVPMRMHTVALNYDKSFSNAYAQLFGYYNRNNDMIESYIRNEGNMSVQSYRNNFCKFATHIQ